MAASPSSFDTPSRPRRPRARRFPLRLAALLAGWLAAGVLAAGCVTVRPEDKEYLADPSMTFSDEGRVQSQEQHVLNNREGSFGASGVGGGGCGCN